MMEATDATATRREMIDRYVELAAVDYVAGGGSGWPTSPLFRTIELEGVAYERSDRLADELWPDESGPNSHESREYEDAWERVLLLAADLFDRYAEFSAHEAGRCRGQAYARRAVWVRGEA
jgi:hypothetical protein